MFKGLSLFSSAGVAELNLNKKVEFHLANELLKIRADVHRFWHPKCEVVTGDVSNEKIKSEIIQKSKEMGIDFILATPPCQGVSLIGKNKRNEQFLKDQRNFLIFDALEIVDEIEPSVVIVENVDRFAKMVFPYDGGFHSLEEILRSKYSDKYDIDVNIYNSADYGVPQARKRLIIVMYDKNKFIYERPKMSQPITVEQAIGFLPSLESGQQSDIKHHNARKHIEKHITCMMNTPTGKSAFQNNYHYPRRSDGSTITGYPYTYKRIDWDRPAPTITMRSDAISATHTVHPGREIGNGLYSDARVLTLRELFILSSIDPDIDLPSFASEVQIRHIIGEAVPPKLMQVICNGIK